jgi:hypothetical protein
MKDEQEDLANWVEEIHDGMYAVLVRSSLPPVLPNAF